MARSKTFKTVTAEQFIGPGLRIRTGDEFYVSSITGSNNRYNGETWDTPFATLTFALGKCSTGDTIYLLPGHAENLTVATSVNANVAGVNIIGIGEGNLIPKFSATALAGSITVTAANVLIENIWVYSNATDGITKGITVAATATGSTLRKIKMTEAANTKEFLTWIGLAAAITDFTIEDCYLQGIIGGTDISAIVFAGASTNCVLRNNYIYGDFSGAVVDHLTGASVTLLARGNRMANMDTGAGLVFSLKSDATAYCIDNYAFGNKNDAVVLVGAAAVWHQNYGSNTLTDSGILFPAAAAAIP